MARDFERQGLKDTYYLVAGSVWNMARTAILSAANLIAIGTIIELVDQIRWDNLYKDN